MSKNEEAVRKRQPGKEKLVCFLYLLMRDRLPTGIVAEVMNESTTAGEGATQYSNEHLEAMAREYANRLVPEKKPWMDKLFRTEDSTEQQE